MTCGISITSVGDAVLAACYVSTLVCVENNGTLWIQEPLLARIIDGWVFVEAMYSCDHEVLNILTGFDLL